MEAGGKGPFGPKGKYHYLHIAFADRNHVPPITKTAPPKRGRHKGR